jgi:hypothetical protein
MTSPRPLRATTSGWVVFAAVTVFVSSLTNFMWALTLLLNSDWVVITPEAILRFNLRTAGIIYLLFGILQVCVAGAILTGQLWARLLGILGASLNLMANMAFMSLYPAWAWLGVLVNGLVVYGLTVHGDEVAEL